MGQGLIVSTLGAGTLNPDGTIDPRSLQVLLNDLRNGVVTVWQSGNTAGRPVNPILSQLYYDTQTVEYLYCSAVRNGAVPAQWIALGTGGGGGTGTVTSITATAPIVVTPDPITSTGTVSHAASGATAATYGDSTHVAQITVNGTGHVTSASAVAISTTATNSFETIAVSGQSSIVADSPTDTLTLVAGSGVTLTTNAGTDTLTISASLTSGVQEYTTPGSGNFSVPSGVTAVFVVAVGAGAGGQTSGATIAGGGGGAGEQISGMLVAVPSGGTVAYTVGAGGATDANGGLTSFGVEIALGGLAGATAGKGGVGGGASGGAGGATANPGGPGLLGLATASLWFSGGGGGGGGSGTTAPGGAGGGAGGRSLGGAGGVVAASKSGGGGGAATIYGPGGAGGTAGGAGNAAASTSYGAGGGGGSGGTQVGGAGAGGYLLLSWV